MQARHSLCCRVLLVKSRSFEGSGIHDKSYRKRVLDSVLSPGIARGLLYATNFEIKGTVQRPGRVFTLPNYRWRTHHGLYNPSEEGFAAEIEKGDLVLDVLSNV